MSDNSGTQDDVAEMQAIIRDVGECGGPRAWHLEDMLRQMIHMRRLIGELAALSQPEKEEA